MPTVSKDRLAAGIAALLAKHEGDAEEALRTLYSENYNLREARRMLQERVPEEGSVILKPQEAALWEAYSDLGPPDALVTLRQQLETTQATLADLERERLVAQAAEIVKAKPRVFRDLLKASGRQVTITDKGAVMVGSDPFDTLIEGDWAEYKTVLLGEGAVTYPPQGSGQGRGAGAPDLVGDFITRQAAKTAAVVSPLKKV